MPFQSEKQRRYLWANEPEIARDWADTYGSRIPAAYGGIMDTATGRRGYFLGSIGKIFGKVAKAAKKVLKSPVGKAAIMAGIGFGIPGTSFGGLFGRGAGSMFGQASGMLPTSWKNKLLMKHLGTKDGVNLGYGTDPSLSWSKLGILGATALPWLMPGPKEDDEGDKGADYDLLRNKYASELMNIKAGVNAGSLNPNQWSYLPSNYTYTGAEGGRARLSNGGDPFLREEYDKYVFEMEEMGLTPMTFEEFKAQARAGMYAGGQSIPSDYTMEDAMMTTTQDKLGGITDVMKQADLYRKGSVGQMYAAQGGRIGYQQGQLVQPGLGRPGYAGNNVKKNLRDHYILTPSGYYIPKRTKSKSKETSKKADGGRIGYDNGGDVKMAFDDTPSFELKNLDLLIEEYKQDNNGSGPSSIDDLRRFFYIKYGSDGIAKVDQATQGSQLAAQGGRIGYDAGGQTGHPPITIGQISQAPPKMPPQVPQPNPMPAPQPNPMAMMNPMARGMNPMGRGTPRVMAQEGGLMDLGGMEKDYRNDGGFVPIGGEEKADDVPARLSRNEFVFTADAVRGAGGGDIDKGAEIMENIMKNLEQGGQISEETQGLSGAQEMFGVSERLSEVV